MIRDCLFGHCLLLTSVSDVMNPYECCQLTSVYLISAKVWYVLRIILQIYGFYCLDRGFLNYCIVVAQIERFEIVLSFSCTKAGAW